MSAIAVDLPARCTSCGEAPALRHAIGARSLAGRILRAQEEERARVARELHDVTGQALALMLVRLTTLAERIQDPEARRELDALGQLVVETLDRVRTLATDLGPTVLRDLGLPAALDVVARASGARLVSPSSSTSAPKRDARASRAHRRTPRCPIAARSRHAHRGRRSGGGLVTAVIRVLLADDHPILVEGLRCLIDANADLHVVAVAHDADATVTAALDHRPDVIVMDISMPGGGLQALRRVTAAVPEAKVVILTIHTGSSYVHEALRQGAQAYVPKRAADRDLLAAIRCVARGEAYLAPSVARTLLSDAAAGRQLDLSLREREVLSLTASGMTNREIGARLSLSVKTVDTYRARAMAKLDLHRRSEVVEYALGHGMLEPT